MGVQIDNFDGEQEQPRGETIPEGIYRCIIVASEKKATKSGTGAYMQLTWQILDGAHEGNQLKTRLNLWNQSDVAIKIARQELGEICRAIGKTKINDSQQMHNLPADLSVVVGKPNDEGKCYNEIKKYMPPAAVMARVDAPVGEDVPAWG